MEFEVEVVVKFSEKEINVISIEYKVDISKVRGVVENVIKIFEVKKIFGLLERYFWGFVNYKFIFMNYKLGYKIFVKILKLESISKDMVC